MSINELIMLLFHERGHNSIDIMSQDFMLIPAKAFGERRGDIGDFGGSILW